MGAGEQSSSKSSAKLLALGVSKSANSTDSLDHVDVVIVGTVVRTEENLFSEGTIGEVVWCFFNFFYSFFPQIFQNLFYCFSMHLSATRKHFLDSPR